MTDRAHGPLALDAVAMRATGFVGPGQATRYTIPYSGGSGWAAGITQPVELGAVGATITVRATCATMAP